MIVIADAGPLRYFVLIEQAEILHELYGRVLVPQAAFDELQRTATPTRVREWLARSPEWIETRRADVPPDAALQRLGEGESQAIILAEQLRPDALIMDDRDGREEAARRGLTVIGTLGVLSSAAEHGLLDLPEAFRQLQQTNFRASAELYQQLLDRDAERRSRRPNA